MHNVLENLKDFQKTDLSLEYKKALKNENFKTLVSKLKLSDNILMKYTSLLENSALEYSNCMNCKNIANCKNKICGYANLPIIINGNLEFTYKPCKYQTKIIKNTKFLDNIKYFNTPTYLKEASIDKIYKTDKNRFKTINWLLDFIDNYENDQNQKGLYLHGNFGCGKTYLISAVFNELAKKGYKSSIIFWPEFLRQIFYDDFKEKFDYVKKVPLLLIDDIGAENLTAYNRDEVLCPLLQYRMDNGLTTFFTSNLTIEELTDHLSNSKKGIDEVKAGRVIARINQLTEDLEMISKNLRK